FLRERSPAPGQGAPGGSGALQQPDATSAGAFRARLGLEGNPFAPPKCVEVRNGAPVEEILLSVLPRDESKAAIGHHLLDGPLCHLFPQVPRSTRRPRPFEEPTETRPRREPLTASGLNSIREQGPFRARLSSWWSATAPAWHFGS